MMYASKALPRRRRRKSGEDLKLTSARKAMLLAIFIGGVGLAALAAAKTGGRPAPVLEFRAKELIGIAVVLAFVFFPWRRA
jgi:hypothetical protein